MTIIAVRPSKRFKGAWSCYEAPGVEPAFAGPEAKEKAVSYARVRFGGAAGEVHAYDATGSVIAQATPIDGRDWRCSAQPDGVSLAGKAGSSESGG